MTKGKPMPVILRFTFPLMIGNMFQQLYNMADTIIVGRYVGADALAAAGSTIMIMLLLPDFPRELPPDFPFVFRSAMVCPRYRSRSSLQSQTVFFCPFPSPILTILCLLEHEAAADHYEHARTFSTLLYLYYCNQHRHRANVFYTCFPYSGAVGNSQIPLFFHIFCPSECHTDLLFTAGLQMGVAELHGPTWLRPSPLSCAVRISGCAFRI